MATDMALEDVLPMLAVVHEPREVQTILENSIPGVWSLDLGAGACLHCFRAWGDLFPKPANRSASCYCCNKLGNKIVPLQFNDFPYPTPPIGPMQTAMQIEIGIGNTNPNNISEQHTSLSQIRSNSMAKCGSKASPQLPHARRVEAV